jgi:RimJ/RimL family protein N-acetyltransferase
MQNVIIETPRLLLYEMAVEDAENFFALNNDPEVMQYTGEGAFENVEAARQLVRNYPQYKKYGYGRWTVRLKEKGAFLGWCGLKFNEDIEEVDIGYRLLKKHWNKGYATEASQASLDFGFEKFGIRRIIGRADKNNAASIWVFEKLGLSFEKYYFEDGVENVLYAIEK